MTTIKLAINGCDVEVTPEEGRHIFHELLRVFGMDGSFAPISQPVAPVQIPTPEPNGWQVTCGVNLPKAMSIAEYERRLGIIEGSNVPHVEGALL